MDFIAAGDFYFPFNVIVFAFKQLYVWSFQTGALNLDGIIRIYSKIPLLLIFLISNNITVAYSYILLTFIIGYASFYFFLKYFIRIDSRIFSLLIPLFFVINPVFLGNLSKIGLVLAVAMLPILLVLIHKILKKDKYYLIIPLSLALNLSLIHPFTFLVNLLILCGFGIYLIAKNFHEFRHHFKCVALYGFIAILLNVYIILPLLSLGTIEKASLSQSVEQATNYTDLIYIANTRNIFTSLSFAKDVLKDYNFYDTTYQKFYYASAFLLCLLILYLYYKHYNQLHKSQKKLILLSFSAFLLLSLIATVSLLGIDQILKIATTLPGGWSFRAPLKWQLYQPFFLMLTFAILTSKVRSTNKLKYAFATVFILSAIGLNGYIARDIYKILLTPRSIEYFKQLSELNLDNKRLLIISNPSCSTLFEINRNADIEFRQIILSQNVQVTTIQASNLNQVNYSDYNYAVTCEEDFDLDEFRLKVSYPKYSLFVLENTNPQPHIYAIKDLFSTTSKEDFDGQKHLVEDELKAQFNYVKQTPANQSISNIYSLFSNMGRNNIDYAQNAIVDYLATPKKEIPHLDFYQNDGAGNIEKISKQGNEFSDSTPLNFSANTEWTKVSYLDPTFTFKNSLTNSSFEDELWERKVSDCYRYDDNPKLNMRTSSQSSKGKKSLQLEAKRHIACTSTEAPISPNTEYLLSFDYQSPNSTAAGYHVEFSDNESENISERITIDSKGWHQYDKVIKSPPSATTAKITVYAYEQDGVTTSINRYDNFSLIELPNIRHKYYLVQPQEKVISEPQEVAYNINNPSLKTVRVKGAKEPFYLKVNDVYHDDWIASAVNRNQSSLSTWLPLSPTTAINPNQHFQINGQLNAWYINPATICSVSNACTHNKDGSYNFDLRVEFLPQRWFYIGLIISGLTVIGYIVYLITARYRSYRKRKANRIWVLEDA